MSKEIELKTVDHRHSREKEQLINRLKRIEGQVRGIQNMVESDRYCVDILIQISAINAAMKKVSLQLMENHTKHCVAGAIQKGNGEEAISELMDVIERLTKT
ncbi:metal-sensing transcriptional repressor [Halalkalibacter krulwichiae]|uniref:Copper-sensing transcriptional repressor CsoR n=1 Tax=Halalkalibacter krulwichiae TaxID=199441 RepID=A0A1X9MDK4_9BACI|nr:metal-sensing transcriptional repressor [Halalkalibacter krulwichiae]ARK30714.1 Copper-sensing transcriptional repressor CsoR [Halalkalibacter krulwichiae]